MLADEGSRCEIECVVRQLEDFVLHQDRSDLDIIDVQFRILATHNRHEENRGRLLSALFTKHGSREGKLLHLTDPSSASEADEVKRGLQRKLNRQPLFAGTRGQVWGRGCR